jgi:hypothetical protein
MLSKATHFMFPWELMNLPTNAYHVPFCVITPVTYKFNLKKKFEKQKTQ